VVNSSNAHEKEQEGKSGESSREKYYCDQRKYPSGCATCGELVKQQIQKKNSMAFGPKASEDSVLWEKRPWETKRIKAYELCDSPAGGPAKNKGNVMGGIRERKKKSTADKSIGISWGKGHIRRIYWGTGGGGVIFFIIRGGRSPPVKEEGAIPTPPLFSSKCRTSEAVDKIIPKKTGGGGARLGIDLLQKSRIRKFTLERALRLGRHEGKWGAEEESLDFIAYNNSRSGEFTGSGPHMQLQKWTGGQYMVKCLHEFPGYPKNKRRPKGLVDCAAESRGSGAHNFCPGIKNNSTISSRDCSRCFVLSLHNQHGFL